MKQCSSPAGIWYTQMLRSKTLLLGVMVQECTFVCWHSTDGSRNEVHGYESGLTVGTTFYNIASRKQVCVPKTAYASLLTLAPCDMMLRKRWPEGEGKWVGKTAGTKTFPWESPGPSPHPWKCPCILLCIYVDQMTSHCCRWTGKPMTATSPERAPC